jgi:hypothetical protein
LDAIWDELGKVELFCCPGARDPGYKEDGHYEDPHHDPDVIKSYYFFCLELRDGHRVTDILVSVYKPPQQPEIDFYGSIEPFESKIDAETHRVNIETKIRIGIRAFLQSVGII